MKFITLMNKLEEKRSLRERFEEKYGRIDANIHFAGNAIAYYEALMKAADDVDVADKSIENPFAFLRDECEKISDLKFKILEGMNWATSGLLVDEEVRDSKNELIFVVNFINTDMQKVNFATDVINPNNPLQVTPILIGPNGASACSYLAQIEPLDDRFISILPVYHDSTHKYLEPQENLSPYFLGVPDYNYNHSFSGNAFDYYAKKKAIRKRIENKKYIDKGTNLKKIFKNSIRAGVLTVKDVELVLDKDMSFSIRFDKDIYNKADVITVATFIYEPDISIDNMLNPCRVRGTFGVNEEIIDDIVHTMSEVRVNTVFLKDGKIRIISTLQNVRI